MVHMRMYQNSKQFFWGEGGKGDKEKITVLRMKLVILKKNVSAFHCSCVSA